MENQARDQAKENLVDQKLTELALLAKELCPDAKIEINRVRYEDEDGRIKVFPPPSLSEAEEEDLEAALNEKCIEFLEENDLFILSAVFDSKPN